MRTSRLFTTYKRRIQKFKEGDSKRISQNELNEACFQHDIPYGSFEEQLRKIYYVINHLILLKIQNIMGST